MSNHSRSSLTLALLGFVASSACLPGVVLAQADQILPPIGGRGGGQFFARCTYPDILTGFELRTGDDVDAIRPICARAYGPAIIGARVPHAQSFGGTGGNVAQLLCPDNTPAVNGLKVAYEGEKTVIVNTLHLYCSAATANQPLTTYPTVVFDGSEIRRTGGSPFTGFDPVPLYEDRQTCPEGLFVVGINGRSGIWLDSVGLICGAAKVRPDPMAPGSFGLGNIKPPKPKPITTTAVVKQVERGVPMATAGSAAPVRTSAADLDALALRGEGIAAQDPLSAELRSRTEQGAPRRGFDIGMAAAEGQTQDGPGKKKIHDSLSAAEQPGFDRALAFSLQRNRNAKFAEVGALIASSDAVVAEARAAESDVFYWLGFDIASGIFGDPAAGAQGNTATGPGSLGIRDALHPAAQRGFNASVALHLQRDYR